MTVLRATILGCGASFGVPRVGNDWGLCDPAEPKNRRTRCALLLERIAGDGGVTTVLVDTGPEIRQQLLAAGVRHLDGVVYTHPHADHIHGIDDLRSFWLNDKQLVQVYADQPTSDRLMTGFGYCFLGTAGTGYPPILKLNVIEPGRPLTITGAGGPLELLPFGQKHGEIPSLGIKTGGLAYSCDVSDFPAETLPLLADLDVWIIDALRHASHGAHLSLADAIAWLGRMKPRQGILTHMHTDLDYGTLIRTLPAGIEPAYDGMVLELPL